MMLSDSKAVEASDAKWPTTTTGMRAWKSWGGLPVLVTGTDFVICQGQQYVHVANTGSPPQLFQARIPVVVVGHFASDTSNNFDSDTIMVKHSSTYTAEYPNRVKVKATGAVC